MLGHRLVRTFSPKLETYAALRRAGSAFANLGLFDPERTIGGVSAQDFDSVLRALRIARPDVVVNCIGIVKQQDAAKDALSSISVNALFPHRLAEACGASGTRLIHISTDCVFSGRKGCYTERDVPDAEDLYGRTKLLGELSDEKRQPHCLTLRTSIIGHELDSAQGLLEWFLSQRGKAVRGYSHAIFSGFTTDELAGILLDLIVHHPDLHGLYHVSAEAIDKYSLLKLIRDAYSLDIDIEPFEDVRIDRSLDSSRFRQATGYTPPSWPDMIGTMHSSAEFYTKLRG
jgi:dTDP-4-dehydrorhamnose reductase